MEYQTRRQLLDRYDEAEVNAIIVRKRQCGQFRGDLNAVRARVVNLCVWVSCIGWMKSSLEKWWLQHGRRAVASKVRTRMPQTWRP